ncbi:hypothetical protein [Streptomyces iconiensis]|uniref:Uncharacterized protein n=1 Tax=Streptomyces iconiensis TaxID=1384038 RepID=A0ABT7A4G0_9ACTN|nr:hypothetical protein [Streptomyces iconiensis]MDJ1136233.1 hypothetical protein [Streptomyces iconiensis]
MNREDVNLIIMAVSALSSATIAIGTIASVWYAREAAKRRGKHRR